MEEWYDERPCDGWDDFLEKVQKVAWKSVLYRGEIDAADDQELKSSFDRAIEVSQKSPKHEQWKYEAAILREFKRRAHHYVSDTPNREDSLEWLALMRHFGAPTRLIDFTYSHYIAAYFAFSNLGCKSRAVWAIDLNWLSEESERRCREIWQPPAGKIDLDIPEHFTRCFLEPTRKPGFSRCFVAHVNPERMNRRLTIQQGCFLCPGDIEKSFKDNLKSTVTQQCSQKHIVKLVIPHSARNRALTELKHMNITRASLFPDLGGLAQSLNDRFELLFKDYDIHEETLTSVVTWKREKTDA